MWNKDEIKGKAEQVKGAAKEKVGEFTENPDLEAEGEVDQFAGKVREVAGTAKRRVGDAVEEVRKKVSH